MNQRSQIKKTLKERKPYLKDRFKISSIGYSGFFAKDQAHRQSDVDLLASFSATPGWKFMQLKSLMEEMLRQPVDLVTNDALKRQLKSTILKKMGYV